MHLGNGAITPGCGIFALGAAATSTAIALIMTRSQPRNRNTTFTAAALGAAVFAAQMFNVQILPFSSVHLIGGVLLAWVLGPSMGVLIMTAVLTIEAVMLGDGGLLALGVNVINMGIVPALFVIAARRFTKSGGAVKTGGMLAAASFLATVSAAGLVTLEVAIGRTPAQLEGWGQFAAQMVGAHALFGVLEAIATVAIVALLGSVGGASQGEPLQLPRAWSASIIGLSLLIALLSAPALGVASAAPDGYETAVANAKQAGHALGELGSVANAGTINATVQAWQDRLVNLFPGPKMARDLTSTLIAGAVAWGLALACSRRRLAEA